MNRPQRYRLLVLLAALLAAGCDGSSDPSGSGGPPGSADVPTLAMDALVVMVGDGLVLFDPSTGLSSPSYPVRLGGSFSPVAVSPDTTRLAFVTATGLTIADIAASASGPSLTMLHELGEAELGPLTRTRVAFSADGEHLVYDGGSIEVATGHITRCDYEGRNNATQPFPLRVPGGHDFVCGKDDALYHDDLVLSLDSSGLFSADGQLAGYSLKLPNGTHRTTLGLGLLPDTRPLATGEFSAFSGGPHGAYVTTSVAGQGGFVTIYRIEHNTQSPPDGLTYSPHAGFATGTAPKGERWRLTEAMLPYLTDGEGRYYGFLGATADGQRVLYRVNSHVIEGDGFTNTQNEIPVESALLSIARDGGVVGFRTSALGPKSISPPFRTARGERVFQPDILDPLGLVDLGGGDLVLPSASVSVSGETSWLGWLGGKPWSGERVGVISPGGRWFARARNVSLGEPPGVCITPVEAGATSRCLVPTAGVPVGSPQAFVGVGLSSAHASDPPRILATSRTAAWDGAQVIVFGARFGASGTLRVGEVTVPAQAITSWSDRRIAFTMDPALPAAGALTIDAPTGTSEGGRAFWLHRTPTLTTPLDGVPIEIVPLAQGLNTVDLGDLADFQPILGNADPLRLTPEMRLPDGRYLIHATGASEPVPGRVTLRVGDYTRILNYRLEDRLADPTRWEMPSRLADSTPGKQSTFAHIAGDLVTLGSGSQHPFVQGARVAFGNPAQRMQGTTSAYWGIPDFWRERPDGESAWVAVKFNNYQYGLRKQTGWRFDGNPEWGYPQHAAFPLLVMNGMQAIEGADDVVIVTGTAGCTHDFNANCGAFALSADDGETFAEPVTPDVSTPTQPRVLETLREPIRVDAAASTFFLVLEAGTNGPGLLGVHAVALDGTFTPDIADVPAGVALDGGLVKGNIPFGYATKDGEVLLYFASNRTLVRADFDAVPPHTWQILPSSADAGRVASIYHEQGSDEVIAVLDDGVVMRANSDWTSWSEWDLGIELPLQTRVKPMSLGRLTDGRWLVHAQLQDGRPGAAADAPSPISAAGYLVSPAP